MCSHGTRSTLRRWLRPGKHENYGSCLRVGFDRPCSRACQLLDMQRRSFLQSLIMSVAPYKHAERELIAGAVTPVMVQPAREELKVDIEALKTELDESGLVIIPEL